MYTDDYAYDFRCWVTMVEHPQESDTRGGLHDACCYHVPADRCRSLWYSRMVLRRSVPRRIRRAQTMELPISGATPVYCILWQCSNMYLF